MSYRREDTGWAAGWLFDRLADHYGRDQIFKDVDSIELGDDFVQVITDAVGSCHVFLALIGHRWLTVTDPDGQRCLDNPGDFVRLEIQAALTRHVRVIPILVDRAQMPHADQLPESLAPLARRQALELSPNRFGSDFQRLLPILNRTITTAQQWSCQQAEEAASRQRLEIEQLQGQLRGRAAARDWEAVIAVSEKLTKLDPAAADPDALASTAREQITRRQRAEAVERHNRQVKEMQQKAPSPAARASLPPASAGRLAALS